MPGKMPIQVPISDERMMLSDCFLRSPTVMNMDRTVALTFSTGASISMTSLITWLITSMPRITGSRRKPVSRSGTPKLRRTAPEA